MISGHWLLVSNFLGVDSLLDLDFGLILLDLDDKVLVDLCSIFLSGRVLNILICFRWVFLDLLGSLLGLSSLHVNSILLSLGQLWSSFSLILGLSLLYLSKSDVEWWNRLTW